MIATTYSKYKDIWIPHYHGLLHSYGQCLLILQLESSTTINFSWKKACHPNAPPPSFTSPGLRGNDPCMLWILEHLRGLDTSIFGTACILKSEHQKWEYSQRRTLSCFDQESSELPCFDIDMKWLS